MINLSKVGSLVKIEETGRQTITMSTTNLAKILEHHNGKVTFNFENGYELEVDAVTDISIEGTPVTDLDDLYTNLPTVFPEEGGGSSTPVTPGLQDVTAVDPTTDKKIIIYSGIDTNAFKVFNTTSGKNNLYVGTTEDGSGIVQSDGKNIIRSINGETANDAGNIDIAQFTDEQKAILLQIIAAFTSTS